MATDNPLTTAAECATRWGISRSTARRYLAPVRHVDRDPATGAMRYRRADADAARAALPGQGARTDLGSITTVLTDELAPAVRQATTALVEMSPTSPVDRLRAIRKGIPVGEPFPSWAVPTPTGRLVALITKTTWDRDTPWHHTATVQDESLAALVLDGLVSLSDTEEEVPEYYGRRQGLRWAPGRKGRRISLTEKGRSLMGLPR
ncbi:hypothetical protein [Streptomyces sp. NRRL F-5630]|uniref:hypothetical protein n=1 Tax=Streptomyces sp. NRRL F-5630 TaxID=1463864 RepID=UPI003D72EB33